MAVLRCCRFLLVAAALALGGGVRAGVPPVTVADAEDEAVGELIGDLMFHADLMHRLDALCPVPAARRDWLAVLRTLPPSARTPELRALSQRLSADAARSMVRGSGGCATREYAQVYAAARSEYEALLEQWARQGA